jgi:sec-independent protein translocase protein TatC
MVNSIINGWGSVTEQVGTYYLRRRNITEYKMDVDQKEIIVATDGTGRFSSIQAAVDSVSDETPSETVIHIKKGIYREKVFIDKLGSEIMQDTDMTVVDHLAELRKRLILIIVPVIIVAAFFYFIAPLLVNLLMEPIAKFKIELVFLGITDAFVVRLKLAIVASVSVLSPLIFYQAMLFIGPGLTDRERKLLLKALLYLTITFISGIVFSYMLVVPNALNFLITFGKGYMLPALAGDRYLSFISIFCLLAGAVFSLPVVLIFLGKLGLLSSKLLRRVRKFVIIAILAVEGIIIPSNDLLTFVYIAAPVVALYEMSIWIVFLIEKKRKRIESGLPFLKRWKGNGCKVR